METKNEEKVSVIELLKRSAKLLFGIINLAFFLFLCSLALFGFLIFFELSLQTTVSLVSQYLSKFLNSAEDLSENDLTPWLIQTFLLYFFPYTLLDLFTTTTIVVASSVVYASEEEPLRLLYLIRRSFKICLITSVYVLFLSTSVFFGFFFDSTNYMFIITILRGRQEFIQDQSVVLFHVVVVLIHEDDEDGEDIYGSNAPSLSAWYIRGNETRDLWTMLLFLVIALATRMPCLYFKCSESQNGNGVLYTGLYVGLICVGNVVKWVSCVVCYHDCNTRALGNKGDVEQAKTSCYLTELGSDQLKV